MPYVPPTTPHRSALLMAGGESRRMGHDKATLIVGGELLWRRQVRTLRDAGFEEIMVARGAHESIGAGERGLIDVPDLVTGCGPLGGLAAGLRQATTRHLLVLAIDLPQMPSWYLRQMFARAEADERGRGLVPVIEGRSEPLAAIYPTTQGGVTAGEALQTGALSMRDVVRELVSLDLMREQEVLEEHRAYFRNVNTPEDLADIERRLDSQRLR